MCDNTAWDLVDLVEEVKPEPAKYKWFPVRVAADLNSVVNGGGTRLYREKDRALAINGYDAAMDITTGEVYYE